MWRRFHAGARNFKMPHASWDGCTWQSEHHRNHITCPETSAWLLCLSSFDLRWMQEWSSKWPVVFKLLVQCLTWTSPVTENHTSWLEPAWLIYLIMLIWGGCVTSSNDPWFYITGRLGHSRLYLSFCKIICLTWEILSCLLLTRLHLFHDPVVFCGDFVVSLEILGQGTGEPDMTVSDVKLCQHYFRILIQRVRISWEISPS